MGMGNSAHFLLLLLLLHPSPIEDEGTGDCLFDSKIFPGFDRTTQPKMCLKTKYDLSLTLYIVIGY